MSDQEIAEFRLDSLTRVTRFTAGIIPKTMTRVSLGVLLAAEDAATDSAGELASIKAAEGARSIVSTVSSAAAYVKVTVGAKFEEARSAEAKARRAEVAAKLDRIPGVGQARASIRQAGSELRQEWAAAGTISVEVVSGDDHAQQAEITESEVAATTPDLIPTN